jgi:sugar phosphate isomerase/epimerase
MTRRDCLKNVAIAALGACLSGKLSQSAPTKNKRDRLACNSWPFRAYFDTPDLKEFRDPKYPLLTQWEFPEFLADHFGIHNVEFLPQHFPDTEDGTIEKVKNGLKKANSRCCNLMGVDLPVFDANGNKESLLREAERWLRVTEALESPTITIALAGKGTPDPKVAADNLRPVVEAAQRRGKKVLFHNDDIKRESADILVPVIMQLGRDRTGTCPDFGNFATRSASYALDQLRILALYASNICHSKDGIADKGKLYRDDFPASMQIMKASDFRGVYSLEFEGLGEPLDGVRNLMQQTEKYL